METVRILMLGDIVGRPGRHACRSRGRAWKQELALDMIVANGENASGGNGLSCKNAAELFEYGIDFITTGNHIWKQKDFPELFAEFPRVIRPANYPDENPGRGYGFFTTSTGTVIGVLNLQGQVFMDPIDSPWHSADRFIPELSEKTQIILVDFHAEATSERIAMGLYLDGRVSAVVGTHTHVPSADTKILPGGTGYQTDLGMVGPVNGILGVSSEPVMKRFKSGLPFRFDIASGPVICGGVIFEIDIGSGQTIIAERHEEVID